ncbi:MAG: NifU family protein [Anaerolineales bacterium]|jgi:Fe-S cluster biogenesis protein NfuA
MTEEASHNHLVDIPAKESMRKLVEALSAYIEQYHGGWVRMVDFDGEVLRVEMGGACSGCNRSATTLRGWVEGTARQFFPNLKRVEQV